MAERMNEMDILFQERRESVTSLTRNTDFDKDGYLKGGVEVKVPEGNPVVNKVGGQRRMLKEKKSEVKWY